MVQYFKWETLFKNYFCVLLKSAFHAVLLVSKWNYFNYFFSDCYNLAKQTHFYVIKMIVHVILSYLIPLYGSIYLILSIKYIYYNYKCKTNDTKNGDFISMSNETSLCQRTHVSKFYLHLAAPSTAERRKYIFWKIFSVFLSH